MAMPNRTRLIAGSAAGLLLVALLAWAIFAQLRIQAIQDKLAPFNIELIESMAEDLTALKKRQDETERIAKRAIEAEAQIAAVVDSQKQLQEAFTRLGHAQGDAAEMRLILGVQLEQLADQVNALKTQRSAPPAPTKSRTKAPVANIAKASRQAKPTPPPPPPAPFELIGIESRAGESFASIAPRGVSRLEDVRLIKPGENFNSWKLLRVESTQAIFITDGIERVVGLR